MTERYKHLYKTKIFPALRDELSCNNIHLVPALVKIVVNMGVGEAVKDSKVIKNALSDLRLISGQQPIETKAKKSEAAFKLREGMAVGCKVTLRKDMMYDFLERLVRIALPRVKEFRGFSTKGFDGTGNFTFGIKEQIIFPEIEYDKIDQIRGMDITIVTTAKTNMHAQALLSKFEMPFLSNKS
jgi:large subunit ribosomal protein L5